MTRAADIILSSFAILVLSLFLWPVVLLLLSTGERKVFFSQKRVGKNGKQFDLFKFATMLEDSPNLPGGDITIADDPRVLPIGRLLRKTKINELPQLLNILRGELSIVGPRPLTPKNFAMYSQEIQDKLSQVRPGLSGIGSIIFRDEESIIALSEKNSRETYMEDISPYKGKLECWFVYNKNFSLYLTLIFMTAWVVILPKSKIAWKLFPDLPKPPRSLRKCFGL